MKKHLLFFVLLPVCLAAQVRDDFSDGDFTTGPAWQGDLGHFTLSYSSAVPENQRPALQLNAPAAGISSLRLAEPFSGDLEWQFWIKMSFNTSSSNFARIYLMTDSPDPQQPLNGYFIQAGGTSDSVSFWRQDSAVFTELLRLDQGYTGNSTNTLRLRITRDSEGNWKFFCNTAGGMSLQPAGECADTVFPEGNYYSIYCQYTSSNITKFYFDDIYAGPLIIDSIPPVLLKAKALNPSIVLLEFSEPLDATAAGNPLNYLFDEGIGHPAEALCLADPSQVLLNLANNLSSGTACSLTITGIRDVAGNEAPLVILPVLYYKTQPYDIIITEIMADPSPPLDLPEFEYLELHNRSGFAIDLEGLSLGISTSLHDLPSVILNPGHFVILCSDDAYGTLHYLAPAIAIPSFNLPNSGAELYLRDSSGLTVCYLQYDLSWYGDDAKDDGGWALEMVDTGNPCAGRENWTASYAMEGGTPGKPNSAYATEPLPRTVLSCCLLSDTLLSVTFSESLDSLSATDPAFYEVTPYTGAPVSVALSTPDHTTALLAFAVPFISRQSFTLSVKPGMANCTGILSEEFTEKAFALPELAEPGEIIINEVLFNPKDDGVDYVELYNRSEKAINLENWLLASISTDPAGIADTQALTIIAGCRVMLPGEYLALCSDPGMVQNQYETPAPEALMEMSSFPSFNNDEGYVLLMDDNDQKIDGMRYSEEMHFLMLLSYDGVSLERISPERSADDATNWHSAAETSGFGTPGYRNSQYLAAVPEETSAISVEPMVFSPDGDGKDDNLGIFFDFTSPGKLLTIIIFNANGYFARKLADNELPGSSAFYSWDGTLDDRTPAPDGIYVILAEVLGMDGKMKRYKKACVLARGR